MATEQEIEYVYSRFITKEPTEFLERINDTNAGIGAVLKGSQRRAWAGPFPASGSWSGRPAG